MQKPVLLLLLICCLFSSALMAQGTLTGDLQVNANFYQSSDSALKAKNSQFYENSLSGGESWLALRYNNKGFTAYLRVDAFHNSALYDPTVSLTAYGIGAYSVSKEIGELTVTGGYIYDQIGSGILFRAYEDRGLLIDNALIGVHLKYKPYENITLKAFTGQQKDVRTVTGKYPQVIKGFNAEGDFNAGKSTHISPGIGVINRTLDESTIQSLADNINSLPVDQRFEPRYNMYGFTLYNTLTVGDLSWYVEGAYKTHEALILSSSNLVDRDGTVFYSTLGYAKKGIAINLSGKRTENFLMREALYQPPLRGVLNWQPVITRIHPQRLISRYTPASQDLSEQALGADLLVSPKDNLDITLNGAHINTLDNQELFREIFGEVEYRGIKNWILIGGAQYIHYNQLLYQVHAVNEPIVKAFTAFGEATYRFTPKKSLRVEVEYQNTKQDVGSWLFALIEYNIAPRWSFSLSDMYNLSEGSESEPNTGKHYYNAFVAYTKGPHRFTISYVKQVAGINCTGGVCRYEPAFSGVRLGITSSF